MIPMGRMPNWTSLWPGLGQLWVRGMWSGLFLAVAAALLLNVLLVASLVWTQLLPAAFLWLGWLMLIGLWASSAWYGLVRSRQEDEPGDAERADDWFRDAQRHYLAQNWFEAETLLGRLVRRNAEDIDSRLMLATLWRHTGREQEALRELRRLEQLEASQPWLQEISREIDLLVPSDREGDSSQSKESEDQERQTNEPQDNNNSESTAAA